MSTTVTYKGSTLTTVNNQTRVLNTSGKWLEGDITLTDVTQGGITPTGTKQINISQNGTTTEDVTNYASAQITVNVSGGTPAISVVDTTDSHGGTVREITALDISDTTAIASDVASGKYFYTANGTKTLGTASGITPTGSINITTNGTHDVTNYASAVVSVSGGGTPSATAHTIYFEFTDETDTTITAYWNDSFISDSITATTPTTYGQKTVTLAQLDGVTWYTRPTETWETLYDDTAYIVPDTPYNYMWLSSLTDVYPTVGSVWRITINGTEYRCTATSIQGEWSTTVVVGNPKYSGGTDDGSSIPACFYNQGYGAWVADTEIPGDTTISLKIERQITA